MRIISGQYKGKRLQLPKGSKTRPTTDFAKEALFNLINNLVDINSIRAIDLFAGTGSIGFELLSQGALFVYWVEIDGRSCTEIHRVSQELDIKNAKLIKADAHKIIEIWHAEPVDLVFMDAPFTFKHYLDCAQKIAKSPMSHPQTLIVMEHSSDVNPLKDIPNVLCKKYGQIMFSIFSASDISNA